MPGQQPLGGGGQGFECLGTGPRGACCKFSTVLLLPVWHVPQQGACCDQLELLSPWLSRPPELTDSVTKFRLQEDP